MQDQTPTPPPTGPTDQLPWQIRVLAADNLRYALPPPIDDTPESRSRRDHVAVAKVAAMMPGNPAEIDLACAHVAVMAHLMECLRQAVELDASDPNGAKQCRAQAASMGREGRGFLGQFERVQAIRRKREADEVECGKAAQIERSELKTLSQALESLPPQRPAAPVLAPVAEPAKAGPGSEQTRWPPLRGYDDWTPEEKAWERLRGEAGKYAVLNPVRVQQIRKLGGLPPDCDYEPPRPEVLHEIIHGNCSNLRWADTYEPYVMPEPGPGG